MTQLVWARALARSGRARELRLAADLSLREVGAAVGVSAVSVLRWERGERRPHGAPGARYGQLLAALEGIAPAAGGAGAQ
jgi:transcriptional regulator with XRE-family HTH domain